MRGVVQLMVALMLFCGCGKRDESVSKSVGKKAGEALTEFASGVGKGIDKEMLVNAELSDELAKQGITKTVAKAVGIDHSSMKAITVYFIAKDPFKAKLIAKALNDEGLEIGRSVVDVEFTADDAKYVTFQFDAEMDTQLVEKYFVDIKK